jgi:hypothetical protein
MSVITLPDSLIVTGSTWKQERKEIAFRSVFGSQTQEVSAPVWAASYEFDEVLEEESGALKALSMQLQGQRNQLAAWDVARPVPRGTLRGTLTLKVAHAQGATSLQIQAAAVAGKTLLAGDWLGLGSGTTQQVVMCTADGVTDSAGVITVPVMNPLRNAFVIGAGVVWDRPKALFRQRNAESGWSYSSIFASGFGLDLVEDWRP